MKQKSSLASFLIAFFALAQHVGAQCEPGWQSGYALQCPDDPVNDALSVQEDGESAFYVTGEFRELAGVLASRIARWSPSRGWQALGSGLDGLAAPDIHGQALAWFDDGSGPALYVAGQFETAGGVPCKNVARWDGTSWSSVGAGLAGPSFPFDQFVHALLVHDDGSGAKLYAGGNFSESGGVPISRIARWDGTAWSEVGGGIHGEPGDPVHALAEYDDPSSTGPKLYAGGVFSDAGGVPVSGIARWDGVSWGVAGGGANGAVRALKAFDGGGISLLYAGGDFTSLEVAANRIAFFDGAHWTAIGAGLPSSVLALGTLGAGSDAQLFAGGSFTYSAGSEFARVVRVLPNGFMPTYGGPKLGNQIRALASFDGGSVPKLFVGGRFTTTHLGRARHGVFYDGTSWSLVGGNPGGFSGELNAAVEAFQVVDHGGAIGRRTYVGGGFDVAGNVFTRGVARLDGASWTSIGGVALTSGTNPEVTALASFDFGLGQELVVAGSFLSAGGTSALNIARYDGTQWRPVGSGFNGGALDLELHDDGLGGGTRLYASAYQIAGEVSLCSVARWNGSAWESIGTPLNSNVRYMRSFDDGTGPALYVAATPIGGTAETRIQRWNGTVWTPIGFGLTVSETPTAFAVFDSGNGPRLCVGTLQGFVREWDGAAWNLRTTAPGEVHAMQPFDDGTGLQLYIGCGTPANRVVRWNGSVLESLGTPMGIVDSLAVLDTPNGPTLFVGGSFDKATPPSGVPWIKSDRIARWGSPCPSPGTAFCSGDGTATACPCGNAGAPGHGCASSFDANGAELVGSGVPRVGADTFALHASGVSNSIVTFIQGTSATNGGLGSLFGDGLRCAGGAVLRLGTVLATSNAASYPGPGQQPVSIRGAIPPVANVTRAYQVWYRNSVSFCTPATFNLTNGLSTFWAP